MRTLVIGQASDQVKRTADASITALNYAIEAMKPGVTGDEVAHAAWKGVAKDRPEIFYHGVVAYSIGLGFPPNWGDAPLFLWKGQQQRLEPGMVFHLPLAFRDIGHYCVGFSETVAITDSGCEVMGNSPRELVIV
jgi:Xaa-Pro dipeptidase